MWNGYLETMDDHDKIIIFWRARRVKGLGFYHCTQDYIFSLDNASDAKLIEPGVLLEYEGKIYQIASKQVEFIKKDDYERTQRLSPIYHIYLDDAGGRMHLYKDETKKSKLKIENGVVKQPEGAITPKVKLPKELRKTDKPTKEEKLIAQFEKVQKIKKRKRGRPRKGTI